MFLSAALSTTVLAYEPMLVDGKQWNYYCESARGPNYGYYFHYVLRGEQEMGGHQCKVLYRSMRDGQERAYAYLYEEGMRVYYVNVKTGESLLLYDFSLQKGDITNDPFYGDSYIVEDVFEMNGGRQVVRLKSISGYPFPRYWIEGVGSDYDFLLPLEIPESSNWPRLLTVEVGGKTVYMTGYATELITVTGDEYTDSNTNVVYTYNANDDSAEVKAGWRVILGGNGEELSEEDFPGSPNVKSDIAILDKFEIDGHEYTVNKIGEKAFILTGLTKVVIPKTISSIGMDAFAFCDVASVVSYIENPFDTDAFRYLNTSNITLFVPKGCKAKYKAVKGWSNFGKIVEMETSNIQFTRNIEQMNTKDYIYNINGHRLQEEPSKGIYIRDGRKVVVE